MVATSEHKRRGRGCKASLNTFGGSTASEHMLIRLGDENNPEFIHSLYGKFDKV
jgi:hypothetical protein